MQNNVLQLDPRDNVLIALTDLPKGDSINFSGRSYTLSSNVPAKHKFATADLETGADVVMYGVLVGKAVKPRRLPSVPLLAYPHGRSDPASRRVAADAGYRAAFTTDPGRNGAGTDPFRLRRIGVKAWDSRLSFLWKVVTGELLPDRWEVRRVRRGRPWSRPRRSTPAPDGG